MPIPTLKNTPGTSDYKPCPAGTFSATVVRIYYLGTQPSNDPKYKPAKKVVTYTSDYTTNPRRN